jgi:hypothetical protein
MRDVTSFVQKSGLCFTISPTAKTTTKLQYKIIVTLIDNHVRPKNSTYNLAIIIQKPNVKENTPTPPPKNKTASNSTGSSGGNSTSNSTSNSSGINVMDLINKMGEESNKKNNKSSQIIQ